MNDPVYLLEAPTSKSGRVAAAAARSKVADVHLVGKENKYCYCFYYYFSIVNVQFTCEGPRPAAAMEAMLCLAVAAWVMGPG